MISRRLAEMTFAFLKGEDITKWLETVGGCVCEWVDNTLYVRGHVVTAISRKMDPVTIYVCLGFTLFGLAWPWMCGGGMNEVNKRWRKQVQKEIKS